jgi:plasmid stabilization system protein ParE
MSVPGFALSQHATQDLDDRVIDKLHEHIKLIARNPRIGHRSVDLAEHRTVLFWPADNYVILYRGQ